MAITVGELVADPLLKTRVVAGAAGTGRRVNWAHSCELDAPWEWLGQGDLVMTTGFPIPAEPAAQAAWVERLDVEGLSGLAIGQELHAPPIHPAMLDAADRAGFPILSTAYEIPFVALSRAVVLANQREEQAEFARMIRVYDRVRMAAVEGHDAVRLMAGLGEELDAELHCVDREGGVVVPFTPPLPAAMRAELADALAERTAAPPAVLRLQAAALPALVVPVPSAREALLVVAPHRDPAPSLALLQHVATIVALEVEKLTAEREHRRRLGSELLAQIIDAKLDGDSAASQLRAHGLEAGELVVAALERPRPSARSDMHARLADRGVAHVLLRRGETLLIALNADPDGIDVLLELAGEDAWVGLSDPAAGPGRVPDAAREAQWALRAARIDGRRMVPYGENDAPFMPKTIGEATMVVQRILGPLLDYDREHNAELVASLGAFLRANRSWQRAAESLFIHKQTLVYRMKRVEELSGRRMDDTGDVAQLWLALQALELTGPPEPHAGQAARAPG